MVSHNPTTASLFQPCTTRKRTTKRQTTDKHNQHLSKSSGPITAVRGRWLVETGTQRNISQLLPRSSQQTPAMRRKYRWSNKELSSIFNADSGLKTIKDIANNKPDAKTVPQTSQARESCSGFRCSWCEVLPNTSASYKQHPEVSKGVHYF